MSDPLVSVLIPLYNAENYLSECLDSLANQTYKNLEIIIINDGSTDNSLRIANEYANRYEWIKVYSQENKGAAAARNKAFLYSKGQYIQYFDADDIMHSGKIKSQIEVLKKYGFAPDIATFGKWARFFYTKNNATFPTLKIHQDYEDPLKFLIDAWSNAHYSIGQSWLISRESHQKVGEWDTRISVLDDSVFFAKVAYNAKSIIYVSESKVYWRQDNLDSLSKNISKKGMESHLIACNRYVDIVKENLDYPDLKYALAMEYSKFIFRAYPIYMDLVNKAELALEDLGFDKPLPIPTKKFQLTTKLIGFYATARLFGLKDKITKKIREWRIEE